ncbi:MAG: diacylglycerol/lipid kinase family protein [Ilumatobacteraceae bacterium]
MPRRFRVFINDAAGSVDETDRQRAEITAAFGDVGIDADAVAVSPDDLPTAMRDAWQQGVDAVIIAGGDGTVNCAAQVAVESAIVLGVLPMGTFNHFARDLGMTPDLAAAAKFLSDAEVTSVDVGEVNGRVFVNNASIGVYPTMVGQREDIRARRSWGKIRAAPVAVVRTLRRLPVSRLRLTVDDAAPTVIATPFLFVGNGLFDEHGERVGQRTSLTDHRLGVYVIATTSRWRLVANAIRARLGGVDAAPRMVRRAGETLLVNADRPALEIALDGEPTELAVPLVFRSRAGALRVLAVPGPPDRGPDDPVRLSS